MGNCCQSNLSKIDNIFPLNSRFDAQKNQDDQVLVRYQKLVGEFIDQHQLFQRSFLKDRKEALGKNRNQKEGVYSNMNVIFEYLNKRNEKYDSLFKKAIRRCSEENINPISLTFIQQSISKLLIEKHKITKLSIQNYIKQKLLIIKTKGSQILNSLKSNILIQNLKQQNKRQQYLIYMFSILLQDATNDLPNCFYIKLAIQFHIFDLVVQMKQWESNLITFYQGINKLVKVQS